MRNKNHLRRRNFIMSAMMIPVAPLANVLSLTPSASEGPFYPTSSMRFNDIDNDLVKISNLEPGAQGEVVRISGKVITQESQPLNNVVVEIWQCDANGRYLHTGDSGRRSRDKDFQGFGRAYTQEDGYFEFRTIKPVSYPGRTPHIHVKVLQNKQELLTTQWYLADHPLNKQDFLYQRIQKNQRDSVHLHFNEAKEPQAFINLVV